MRANQKNYFAQNSIDLFEWIAAQFLEKGMLLVDSSGSNLLVARITIAKVTEQETYNLTVEDYHTYFVSKLKTPVHNQNEAPNGKKYIG